MIETKQKPLFCRFAFFVAVLLKRRVGGNKIRLLNKLRLNHIYIKINCFRMGLRQEPLSSGSSYSIQIKFADKK